MCVCVCVCVCYGVRGTVGWESVRVFVSRMWGVSVFVLLNGWVCLSLIAPVRVYVCVQRKKYDMIACKRECFGGLFEVGGGCLWLLEVSPRVTERGSHREREEESLRG